MSKLPEKYTHSLPDGTSFDLLLVRAGTFLMGSDGEGAYGDEQPEHLVRIAHDFYIGKYPVTQAVWKALMPGDNPAFFKGDERPVEQVSWIDIRQGHQDDDGQPAFLDELNKTAIQEDALKAFTFRLPTEAEWEHAAKGGHLAEKPSKNQKAADLYTLYAGSDKLKEVAWYNDNSHSETKTVGLKRANELGIFDMSGNVWEWCEDHWHDDYKNKPFKDGQAWVETDSAESRVLRGGSWNNHSGDCRVSSRNSRHPTDRLRNNGFRLVLSLQFSG